MKSQLENDITSIFEKRGVIADVDYEVLSDEIRQKFFDVLKSELEVISVMKDMASGNGKSYDYAQCIGRETSVKRLMRKI